MRKRRNNSARGKITSFPFQIALTVRRLQWRWSARAACEKRSILQMLHLGSRFGLFPIRSGSGWSAWWNGLGNRSFRERYLNAILFEHVL